MKKKISKSIFLLLFMSLSSSFLGGRLSEGDHEGKRVFFGNLHSHSFLSDDVKVSYHDLMTPVLAFEYAKKNGLDFLAVTDHHMAVDSDYRLFIENHEYVNSLFSEAKKFNENNEGEFVAIPGIEWGSVASGNHINVFGANSLPPDHIKENDYHLMYEWALKNADFVQWNHPDAWQGNKNVGLYGENIYSNAELFVDEVDSVVKTLAILTSVYGGHLRGDLRLSDKKTHRKIRWHDYYKIFLNMGLHLSPSADQETHTPNWGTVTAARTAVWADSLNYESLMESIKENRVYVTEDDEMAVVFQAEYDDDVFWMGEKIPIEEEEVELDLLIKVWQKPGIDNDPIDEGPYRLEVFVDNDGVGGQLASVALIEEVESHKELIVPITAVKGSYMYLRVMEMGGKDNVVGDGADNYINGTEAHSFDGKRDNLNDMAITTPIWLVGPDVKKYVWSSKNNQYHEPYCWFVERIGATDKREGEKVPEGYQRHQCRYLEK